MKLPKIVEQDEWLKPYSSVIERRFQKALDTKKKLLGKTYKSLRDFAKGYKNFGCQIENGKIIFREWLPNAEKVFLIGDFNTWKEKEDFAFFQNANHYWELVLPKEAIAENNQYKLKIYWKEGNGERLSAWGTYMVQNTENKVFNQEFLLPIPYAWKHRWIHQSESPLIYEAHIGMSGEEEGVTTFSEFKEKTLPRIKNLGYNVIQLMAIQEHPYYGSFGYHVSNLFAVSSRFGTPTELKELIDEAHRMGIGVIMDLVHSHSIKNINEGLGLYDGTRTQFFYDGERGEHPAWDSYCFNYEKPEVIHFLLSNIAYWLDEFHFDGFRFDGVTSMLYLNHGLEQDFTSYEQYFNTQQDEGAIVYLMLANLLIHEINKNALSIAEEMSGYPGLASPFKDGGIGFDYRLAMGIPDFWIKMLKDKKDEDWNVGQFFHELTQKRADEKTISYVESHDQALVGDKTIAFRLMDKEMYFKMQINDQSVIIDRGLALHKMIRLLTIATNGGGYLNFMGNEFGHPEWIDFPREGNNWSYKYATRKWTLVDNQNLKYKFLNTFDQEMIQFIKKQKLSEVFPITAEYINEQDKILVFTRSLFLFIFNFNAIQSFVNYSVEVPYGKYHYYFGTDEQRFGGFERIDHKQIFKTSLTNPQAKKHQLLLYLPARTALILKKEEIPSVHKKMS